MRVLYQIHYGKTSIHIMKEVQIFKENVKENKDIF